MQALVFHGWWIVGVAMLAQAVGETPELQPLLERLLLRVANWRFRPKPASRLAPKQPDGEPSLFMFRFYEAAVRNLTHSARSRHHAS